MTIDLFYFKKAIDSLAKVLEAKAEDPANEFLRDASIQRFEYTYDSAWKTLKRYMEQSAAEAETLDALPFPDLIRAGNEQSLLRSDWTVWKEFRNARNTTSHTYDENKAREVFSQIPAFLEEARYLHDKINERQQ